MGMYDEILVPCPKCGELYPAQSKSGPCELQTFELGEAPEGAIVDVNRHAPFGCERCGTIFEVAFDPLRTIEVPYRPRRNQLFDGEDGYQVGTPQTEGIEN